MKRPAKVQIEQLHPTTQLWFYALSFTDLREALRATRICIALNDRPATQEHFDQAELCVLRYSRPFSATSTPSGRKQIRLNKEFVEHAGFDSALHDKLLSMRNSVVAHSDLGKKSVRVRTFLESLIPMTRIYECEPTWYLPTMDELRQMASQLPSVIGALCDRIRIVSERNHLLPKKGSDSWVTLVPHIDD